MTKSEEQPSLDDNAAPGGQADSTPNEGAATPGEGSEPGQAPGAGSNVEKDPDDWATGGEPMTAAQSSYLKSLAERAGESFDPSLNKSAASKRIDELRQRTGRGR